MPYDDSDIPKLIKHQQRKVAFPKTATHLSYSARLLIRSLLDYDTGTRATIDQLKATEWMKLGAVEPPLAMIQGDKSSASPLICQQILGKSKEITGKAKTESEKE